MPSLPAAIEPFAPFPEPVALPLPDVTDEPLVCVQINSTWLQYLVGCAETLTAQSTWNSTDENAINTTIIRARHLIDILAGLEACPMPVEFRLDPADPHYWDYSNDGGATWTRQPDTVSHFTPTYTPDGTSPSGYDESINGGLSEAQIPLLTASDPNAVIKAPSTGDENIVEATATAPGMIVRSYQVGVALLRDGASLQVQKITDLGNLGIAIIEAVETGEYSTAILEIVTALS
jgi:hypothetical protein